MSRRPQMASFQEMVNRRADDPRDEVEAVAWWLTPRDIAQICWGLESPENMSHVEYDIYTSYRGKGDPGPDGGSGDSDRTGITIRRWRDLPPFRIPWKRVFEIVEEHARGKDDEIRRLRKITYAHAGAVPPEEYEAAAAILPRNRHTNPPPPAHTPTPAPAPNACEQTSLLDLAAT